MTFTSPVDVDLFRAVAADAALISGRIQKARLGTDIGIENKGELDLVTEVDRACEAAILTRLRRSFPNHGIVAEESAPTGADAEYIWYVDPLDGTTNFAHNYPFFCTSIGLAHNSVVIASAVYDAVKDELFTAARGRGATCNGVPLKVTTSSDLMRSIFLTGFPYDLRDDVSHTIRLFEGFLHHARALRRDGAAALDLAYLAAGRIDGYFEERLKPWDVMAGSLLVEEAGGRVSRFDGSPIRTSADEVVASNGRLHDAMLAVLAKLSSPK
ncbi:MAG: inositol monophosphatase family protein [Vicinamibacteria bacterium]